MKKSFVVAALVAIAVGCMSLFGAAHAVPVAPLDLSMLTQLDMASLSQLAAFGAVGSMKHLQALQGQRATELAAMRALTEAAAAREDTTMTAEERTKFDAHTAKVKDLDGDIARVQAQIEATRTGGTSVELPGQGRIGASRDNLRDAPNHGFAHGFGEFAMAVLHASMPAAATGFNSAG